MKIREIMRKGMKNSRGFTMIEVIAVVIIIAIISAVVIARGISTDEVKLQVEIDTLKGYIRYAQCLAINDGSPVKWGIQVGEASYTLVRNLNGDGATFDSPFLLPNESSATHSFSPLTATAATVLFDQWGSPNITSITLGGASITITATTGFIP